MYSLPRAVFAAVAKAGAAADEGGGRGVVPAAQELGEVAQRRRGGIGTYQRRRRVQQGLQHSLGVRGAGV